MVWPIFSRRLKDFQDVSTAWKLQTVDFVLFPSFASVQEKAKATIVTIAIKEIFRMTLFYY